MSIKYRTGQGTSASDFTDLVVKVGDTLPIGAIVEYDTSETIPNGWEIYTSGKIKKISPTTPANGNIENQYGTSQTNAYSEEYSNNTFATKDVATTSANGLMSASDKIKLDNGEVYSTTETKIGTWIDGKPLYRKAVAFTNLTTNTSNSLNISGYSIMEVKNIYGHVVGGGSNFVGQINTLFGTDLTNHRISTFYNPSNGLCASYCGNYFTSNNKYSIYIIFEYTKTTD